MAYATLPDIYLALSERAFVVVASAIQSVDINTGTIRMVAHGCYPADRILFSATSGGALPPELDPFTYYTPIRLGPDLFQVADPITGAPIPFSAEPRGWSVKVDHERRLAWHNDDAAARINQRLGAHATPLKPDPVTGKFAPVIVGLNARMAARSAVTSLQIENPEFRKPLDRLFAQAATDGDTNPPGLPGSLLGDYAAGLAVLPQPVDQDTLANMAGRGVNRFTPGAAQYGGCCVRPWQRGTL